jgi:hypothetical protein
VITFTCPRCKREAQAEHRYDGNSIECPNCKNLVQVAAIPDGLEDEPTTVTSHRTREAIRAPVLVSDGRCSVKVVRLVAWVAFTLGLFLGGAGGCALGRWAFPRSGSM